MAANTIKKTSHLNFVHNDEIWKDHVRHELTSQRQKWPERWGYLVEEYFLLDNQLYGRSLSCQKQFPYGTSSRAQSKERLKLPPIHTTPRKKGFPLTTTQEIGWKTANPDCQLENYGKYGPKSRGQYGILKLLSWPQEGAP